MNTCIYPFTPENIEAAHRRAARIRAMRNGEEIPNPETAEADMRPGSAEDRAVFAMVEGKKIREERERLRATRGGHSVRHVSENDGGICFLNEAHTEMLGISVCFPNDFHAA